MPYSRFVSWLKDPNINKDAAELVSSMNILEYSGGTGIFMSGQDFIIKREKDEDDIVHIELKHCTQEELDLCKF
jgi:phospholipid N-methyltransferase